MRIANLAGRLTLIDRNCAVDVADASRGRFGPDVQPAYETFDELRAWAANASLPSYNQNLWMLDRCEGATYLPH